MNEKRPAVAGLLLILSEKVPNTSLIVLFFCFAIRSADAHEVKFNIIIF